MLRLFSRPFDELPCRPKARALASNFRLLRKITCITCKGPALRLYSSSPKFFQVVLIHNPLEEAHRQAQALTNGLLEELYQGLPQLQEEMHYNLQKYGSPLLQASIGGLWAEDLPEQVRSIVASAHSPLEIHIYPCAPDGHHYQIDWFVLTYDHAQGKLRRAMDVEREGRRR